MLFKNYEQLVNNGQTPHLQKKRKDVLDILTRVVESVNPYDAVKRVFRDNKICVKDDIFELSNFENIYVIGFGKASVGMTKAVVESVKVTKGAIITNDSLAKISYDEIEIIIGGHPLPNNGSILGAEKILEIAKHCNKNDLLIVLISGGGSALLCKPRISLKNLQKTTDLLLKSGADINEINTIRKHLSLIKGGQLAKLTKATIISLIISDIINDPFEFISSGPTSPDSTTFFDTKKILEKYGLIKKVPIEVIKVIEEGINGQISETPKKDDPVFKKVHNLIVANNKKACNAALDKAVELGYQSKIITTSMIGEAKYAINRLINNSNKYKKNKTVLITGGETTVKIKGNGKGGRNQELVLGGVESISNTDIVLASFATDGIDGSSIAAGAIADGFTFTKANKKRLDPQEFLEENNSYEFFSELNDVFITGPTGTNVMDIQLILF
jgi:glycerate-2-kinase